MLSHEYQSYQTKELTSMTNDIKSEEKGTSHSSDVTSSCFSRLFGSEADALFHHIHKLQGSLNAEVARANVWLGWV